MLSAAAWFVLLVGSINHEILLTPRAELIVAKIPPRIAPPGATDKMAPIVVGPGHM